MRNVVRNVILTRAQQCVLSWFGHGKQNVAQTAATCSKTASQFLFSERVEVSSVRVQRSRSRSLLRRQVRNYQALFSRAVHGVKPASPEQPGTLGRETDQRRRTFDSVDKPVLSVFATLSAEISSLQT